MTISQLNKLYQRKENYIYSKIKGLEGDVSGLQGKLLELLTSEYIGRIQTKDGKVIVNAYNMRLAAELDSVFDKFNILFQKSVLKSFGNDMLKITEYTSDYFKGAGFSAKKLNSIQQSMDYISARIGISDKGEILKGSYLDTLSQNPEVRRQFKDYVLNSVAGQKDYQGFVKGFKELVVGNKEVNGALQNYYDQYAYDSFNQVDAAISSHFANELKLTYFVYFGSIITTSREFCVKRHGKVFSIKETETWKNDPTLPGKSKEGYNPLIDRGRWRCRHSIQYIPDLLACKKGKTEACE